MKTALLLLLPIATATARVGETCEEIRKRFENTVTFSETAVPKVSTASVQKGDISVQAWAVDDKISRETYQKVTEAQARAIRDKIPGKWELYTRQAGMVCWKMGKQLTATWQNSVLTITDGRADALEAADEKRKLSKEVEGL